jgi:hypothetical protein
MSQVCGHCGTEVEDEALFCPACGQPLAAQEAAPELPPAPDWPEAPAGSAPPPTMTPEEAHAAWARGRDASSALADPAPDEPQADAPASPRDADFEAAAVPTSAPTPTGDEVPPWRRGVAARNPAPLPEETAPPADTAGATRAGAAPQPAGIVTTPTTLSGWLIGVGSLVGALALFLPWLQGVGYTALWGLASTPNILILILLLAIGTSIFLAGVVPAFPHRSLAILAVTLVGVGIGLDAVARPVSAAGAMIFLLALLVAAAGALLPELGLDRPVGGSQA